MCLNDQGGSREILVAEESQGALRRSPNRQKEWYIIYLYTIVFNSFVYDFSKHIRVGVIFKKMI